MFTGLITDIGTLRQVSGGRAKTLRIETSYDTASLELGESIAVDGACLTVTSFDATSFVVDASYETMGRTTIGQRKIGDALHLERALRLGDRLGGHWVSGHIDGVGQVVNRRETAGAVDLEIEAPREMASLFIDKGSTAIDGVSLTINSTREHRFNVTIIPFTQSKTRIQDYKVGRRVNLEGDILGKYVQKLLGMRKGGIDAEFLIQNGYEVE